MTSRENHLYQAYETNRAFIVALLSLDNWTSNCVPDPDADGLYWNTERRNAGTPEY